MIWRKYAEGSLLAWNVFVMFYACEDIFFVKVIEGDLMLLFYLTLLNIANIPCLNIFKYFVIRKNVQQVFVQLETCLMLICYVFASHIQKCAG